MLLGIMPYPVFRVNIDLIPVNIKTKIKTQSEKKSYIIQTYSAKNEDLLTKKNSKYNNLAFFKTCFLVMKFKSILFNVKNVIVRK
jgi:hypothetical protein